MATTRTRQATTIAQRAEQVLTERHLVAHRGGWLVQSADQATYWFVTPDGTCGCPDYRYRQRKCKHVVAVEQVTGLVAAAAPCRYGCGRARMQLSDVCRECALDELFGPLA